jgi:hypothetical protein
LLRLLCKYAEINREPGCANFMKRAAASTIHQRLGHLKTRRVPQVPHGNKTIFTALGDFKAKEAGASPSPFDLPPYLPRPQNKAPQLALKGSLLYG